MTIKTGKQAMIEQFLVDGIPYMFGNPGTVEQGFLDTLETISEFNYILTLQETVAAGIADGYARATHRPTVLQLHSGVGLGNAIGMLYQAKRGHAPLVVVAGEAGVRYDAMDAQMAADLVAMAKPVTKYATRVLDPSSLLRVLRRAVKIAATPPMGPVFVSLPMDVLDAPNTERVVRSSLPATAVLPIAGLLQRAAGLLVHARNPLVLVGDGVSVSGAQAELAHVAELLGADVWSVDSSETNISARHPLSRGQLGHMFGEVSGAVTRQADAVLIVGTYVFPEVFPLLDDVFSPEAKIVHIDLDAYEIAKNFPVDVGLVADPRPTLSALSRVLKRLQSDEDRHAACSRLDTRRQQRAAEEEAFAQTDADSTLAVFMRELARRVPPDVMVFDEALTASPTITAHLPPTLPGHYFLTRGGSLGVGLPGAIGVKLAHPSKTVLGFSGDGGSMYTFQALWTAARHDIGAKFVVCNNRRYELLNVNLRQYWRERDIPPHALPRSFDLSHPDIRFVDLARGLGVPGVRVEKPEQAAAAVQQLLSHDGPFLVDLLTD